MLDYMQGWIVLTFIILITFTFFNMGIRIIPPNKKGIKIRRKKYLNTLEPGFHWIIPGFDRVIKVPDEQFERAFNELLNSGKMSY